MPGELKDPEQSVPFHYDPKYDEAPNQFEPGAVRRCYICNVAGGTFNIVGGRGKKGAALCDQCNDLYNRLSDRLKEYINA